MCLNESAFFGQKWSVLITPSMVRLPKSLLKIPIFAAGGLGISVNCHGGIVWRFFVALTNGNNFAFTERFEEL